MPTLDFDAARRERAAKRDPVRFRLGGKTFTCKPVMPFAWLMDVVANDSGKLTLKERYDNSVAFLVEVLATEADRKRLHEVLRDGDDPIGEDDIYDAVSQLVGVYAARPTSPSNGSSAGRRRNGAASSNGASGRSRARKAASG